MKKKTTAHAVASQNGGERGIRTLNQQIMILMLYR